MKVQLRSITTIRPYVRNPRRNDQAVDAVAASIREFGFRQPIVIDEEGVIIIGHTRYKAALKLGLEKVPVHVATGLTSAQIKAYRIADNQTASLAQWDYDLLPLELAELQKMNVDLDVTGFSADRGTCGSWDITACCAATQPSLRMWIAYWPAPRCT